MALKGNALAILSIALWGMAFPITELLLTNWHPFLLSAVRLLSASFCLIIILLPKIYNNPYLPLTSWGLYFNQISFLGISGYTFFYLSKH